MNRTLLLIPAFLLLFFFSNGQPPEGRRERVETMKIGFLTERLDLTRKKPNRFGRSTTSTRTNWKRCAKAVATT